eukprot:1896028-Amphidinium_carterae.2
MPHSPCFRVLGLKPGPLDAGGLRIVQGVDNRRRLPPGVAGTWNQVCIPPTRVWAPAAEEAN